MSLTRDTYCRLIPLVLATITVALAGCVDVQRIRENYERIQTEGADRYRIRKVKMFEELQQQIPCCDSIVSVRPSAQLTADRSYPVTVGIWPNNQIAEFDGFRSYYVMLSLGEPMQPSRRLTLSMTPSILGFFEPNTKMPAKEFFVPAVTFLDANRKRLGVINAVPVARPRTFELVANVSVPIDTAFIVLHANQEILDTPPQPVVLGNGTAVLPIGPVILIARFQPEPIMAIPALTGSIVISLN